LFGVLYLLLYTLIDPGIIVWYGNLLKEIALRMPIEA
jgi:hypothetical protein